MREAVHIFLKDSRHLRLPIGLLLGWTAFLVLAGARPLPMFQVKDQWTWLLVYYVPGLAPYACALGWGYLIAQVSHADALPGDRQFWLTRPYHRSSLAAAKALFVLAYITLPLAVAQIAIVMLRGLPLGPQLSGLVWDHLLLLSVVLLPIAAAAASTSTLAQFGLVGVAAPVLFTIQNAAPQLDAAQWVRTTIVVCVVPAVAVAILFVQFRWRRTRTSRVIALAGVLAVLMIPFLVSWRAAFSVMAYLRPARQGPVTAEIVRPELVDGGRLMDSRDALLRFHVMGLSADMRIACEAAELTIGNSAGPLWESGIINMSGRSPLGINGCATGFRTPEGLAAKVSGQPVALHAALYITVFGDEQTTAVPADRPPTVVENYGVCSALTRHEVVSVRGEDKPQDLTVLDCETAWRAAREHIRVQTGSSAPLLVREGGPSYSPFPANLMILPALTTGQVIGGIEPVSISTRPILTHVRLMADLPDFHLEDFQLRVR